MCPGHSPSGCTLPQLPRRVYNALFIATILRISIFASVFFFLDVPMSLFRFLAFFALVCMPMFLIAIKSPNSVLC